MNLNNNTILITGGGSGIGRGLAEAFLALGNRVIIAGRRQSVLNETTKANPAMESISLDMANAKSITDVATQLIEKFPSLNVVINNAGVARIEDLKKHADPAKAEQMVITNVLGPIRLTCALLPHFLRQPSAAIINVTSGLGFVPLQVMPTYSSTKAALHSYTLSLRHQLKDTPVEVFEIIPPYVQTELGGETQKTDPRAMPLKDYIAQTMHIFKSGMPKGENCVEQAQGLRYAESSGNFDKAFAGLSQLQLDPSHL